MPGHSDRPKSPAQRMAGHRRRMHAAGFKLKQIWVPDTDASGFTEKCRAQSLAIARQDKGGDEALRFIESTYEWPDH